MYGYPPMREREVVRQAPSRAGGAVRLALTVEEAAEQLGISRTYMFTLIRTKAVESVKIGRLRRVPMESLKAYVQALRDPTEAA